MSGETLRGRTILLTRPAGASRALAELLRAQGARPLERPAIEFRPPTDPAPSEGCLLRGEEYAWIAVTSPQGARALVALARRLGRELPPAARLAAVGPGTARALRAAGQSPALVGEGDAEALARSLAAVVHPGERVLVVRPEQARDALADRLRAAGAHVDDPAFYRTVPTADAAATAARIAEGEVDAIVFSSPSTFHALLGAGADVPSFTEALARTRRVAIGEVTAAALRDAGHPAAAVAQEPTDEGILRALEVALARRALCYHPRSRHEDPPVTTQRQIQRTPLHHLHVAAGARMVEFAGWDMPVSYTGIIEEHMAVRTRAGLFDVSHMGEFVLRGPRALALLQRITPNDVSRLVPGRAHYNALTTPEGTFVDDLLVYAVAPDEYFVVVNAANAEKDLAWIRAQAAGEDVEVRDASAGWALLAVQGPRALDVVRPLAARDPSGLRSYAFTDTEVAGVPCRLSRTGYTGEDGFELYLPADDGPRVWASLMESGIPHGLQPAGLAARDTLRLEACMALYGNDIDDTTTVLEADLAWIVKWDKGEFLGRDALVRQREGGTSRRLVAFEMDSRAIARHGYPLFAGGAPAGVVTSGTYAPFLEKNVGMAYLPAGAWEPGTRFEVEIRGRREPASVVPKPLYRRARG